MVGSADHSRREFLAAGFGVLLSVDPAIRRSAQDSVVAADPSGKLYSPEWAGRSRQPVTAGDNDAAIQAIEKQLKCTCGCSLDVYTCRTTDFTCTVSPQMHQQVLTLAAAGSSADAIIAEFVREHGVVILMAPPKRGFNLAGYFFPSLVILIAGALLVLVMRRWVRRSPPAPLSAEPADATPGNSAELERLRRELQRTEA
ncbi:MAG TPA: cytochrome c-type biogenesis protein CcmH [Gemmatimonadales bacterium]|jgi:cytochrome c-type biogenesis protein CcmH